MAPQAGARAAERDGELWVALRHPGREKGGKAGSIFCGRIASGKLGFQSRLHMLETKFFTTTLPLTRNDFVKIWGNIYDIILSEKIQTPNYMTSPR